MQSKKKNNTKEPIKNPKINRMLKLANKRYFIININCLFDEKEKIEFNLNNIILNSKKIKEEDFNDIVIKKKVSFYDFIYLERQLIG